MPTVRLRFPGGRYHATPWGHHVNEGLIEWPPSPWRLLRALIACGFSHKGWREVPPVARRLVDKLAAVLPLYRLPAASAAHSRHFMPLGTLDKGRQQTTLVFDTWANVGDGELLIHWPCELDSEELDLLGQLAASISYLGRSESWAEAELAKDPIADWNAEPCRDGEPRGPGWEQVSLMAPIPPSEYDSWRKNQQQMATAFEPPPKGKRKSSTTSRRSAKRLIEPYPQDLPACLMRDTSWWKSLGWSQPPGSRRVLYWRRGDAIQISPPSPRKTRPADRVAAVLLAVSTLSGNRSALPPAARTLPQAELLHRALIARVGRGGQVRCPELTGTDELDRPLTDGHRHAHVVPLDLDADGRLDHILIHAPMGLGDDAQRAIRTLRRTWTKGGAGDLQLAVVGYGPLDMLRRLQHPLDQQILSLLGPPGGALVWESVTPFVAPRFLKRRGRNTLAGQVNAELASRGLPPAKKVEVDVGLTRRLRHHVRCRRRAGGPPPADAGYGLRLTFDEPLRGPLLLGYASHFGLGRFGACDA